jgi:uncharacterized membrane protein
MRPDAAPDAAETGPAATYLFWTGAILGVGVAGTLDEVVLHQLLQWHNFYVHTHEAGRTVSDGLFHLASSAMLALGALRLWRQRRLLSGLPTGRTLGAGILIGLGGFNLWDGTVHHKVLRLHPVREGVPNQLPYDVAFIALSLAVLLAGVWLLRRARAAGMARG